MEYLWQAVLVLIALTAAHAAPVRPAGLQEHAIAIAINIYNQQQNSSSIYRRAQDDPYRPSNSFPLKFRIQETVCSTSDLKRPEDCEFKANGIVKDCTANIAENTVVNCITIVSETDSLPEQPNAGDSDTYDTSNTDDASNTVDASKPGKGRRSKGPNVFVKWVNKILEWLGLKEAGKNDDSLCLECIMNAFSS